jgi:hypothetical protein
MRQALSIFVERSILALPAIYIDGGADFSFPSLRKS